MRLGVVVVAQFAVGVTETAQIVACPCRSPRRRTAANAVRCATMLSRQCIRRANAMWTVRASRHAWTSNPVAATCSIAPSSTRRSASNQASRIRPDGLRVANRHQAYWLSLGRALAHSGRDDQEALAAFMNAERAAPVPFALNPMVHDIIAAMVRRARRRSVSEELRIMARRVGIHITDNRW